MGIRGAVAACKVRQLVALDAEVFRSELVRGNLAVLELPDLCRAVGSDLIRSSTMDDQGALSAELSKDFRDELALGWVCDAHNLQ